MANKLYGSENNQAERIIDLYGSSNSQSQRITRLYGPKPVQSLVSVTGTVRAGGAGNVTAFNGTTFLTQAGASLNSIALDYLQIDRDSTGDYDLWVEYSDGTTAQRLVRHGNATEMASYGVTVTPTAVGTDYIDLTPTYNTTYEAELIHQGFGHIDYGYGTIVYYTDDNHTSTSSVILKTQSEVDLLTFSSSIDTITIQGNSIKAKNIKDASFTSKLSSIPTGFLSYCSALETLDLSRSIITTIPDDCFNSEESLRKIENLPQTLVSIGSRVFMGLDTLTQEIILPQSITSIGNRFFSNTITSFTLNVGNLNDNVISSSTDTLSARSSSSQSYTDGINIAGTNRAAWMTKFPNNSSLPYRNLVDAGY